MALKVLELFGGIGACSKALERLGIDYEIADYVEIDKFAVKSFNAMHGTDFVPQDICEWDKDIEVDLVMHGSPCQDFSLAGKQAGGDEGSGTRSSLMYETIRIVEKLKPTYVIWENVKNVIGKKHRHNFDAYLDRMSELGYTNHWQVLNAKDYGVPQNRERVFVVSVLDRVGFEFPKKQELKLKLKDMLEDEVDEKFYLNKTASFFIKNSFDMEAKGNGFRFEPHVKQNAEIGKTITTRAGSRMDDNYVMDVDSEQKKFKFDSTNKELKSVVEVKRTPLKFLNRNQKNIEGDYAFCVDTSNTVGVEEKYHNGKLRIRKLTPKECWRLMGFDDADFDKAEKVNSNAQLYKQAGNSIVVNVLEAILKELLKHENHRSNDSM